MEEKEVDLQEIAEKVKKYAQARKELAILTAVEKGSHLFANLLTDGLVLLFAVLTFLFGSIALGLYLSELFGNTYGGFLVLTAIYFLIGVIVYSTKDTYLDKIIINKIIHRIFKDRHGAE